MAGFWEGLSGVVETVGSIHIQGETIRAGAYNTSNAPEDHPRIESGVDSDGTTLFNQRIVGGVTSGHLLIASGVLLAAAAAWSLIKK